MSIFSTLNNRHFLRKCFRFDRKRHGRYACGDRCANANQYLGRIALKTHVLEKGLSMPNRRMGFGQKNVVELVALCKGYAAAYGSVHPTFIQALQALAEYRQIHSEASFALDTATDVALSELFALYPTATPSEQPLVHGRQAFFAATDSVFPSFSSSRHSLRSFGTAEVSLDAIKDAVALAQNAPSACNRQASRVHIVTDRKLVGKILALQNGNRGFGDNADKLLVLTVDLSFYGGARERNLAFLDSGIYAMNLLYALHYHTIGACPLNWCDSPRDDRRLRALLPLEPAETVTLLIALGSVPDDDFRLALSRRLPAEQVMRIH